jgi:hypothetical protein
MGDGQLTGCLAATAAFGYMLLDGLNDVGWKLEEEIWCLRCNPFSVFGDNPSNLRISVLIIEAFNATYDLKLFSTL